MSTISTLLPEKHIILPMHATDSDSAIRELLAPLVEAHTIQSEEECFESILKRERRMSTGVGKGVALPHGLSDSINDVVMVIGISPEGIDFKAVDGALCHIFILLISPTSQPEKHLKLLSHITDILESGELRSALVESRTPQELLGTLQEWEARDENFLI